MALLVCFYQKRLTENNPKKKDHSNGMVFKLINKDDLS